ncbi:hypothetical protein DQQ10_18830 [Pseudochryseolinea flava]|uniref:Uncharacterized protein n=1 Tax=Pseudochryseolinea flava TaxID=2059302 RepID=A0A364Y1L8_9BACT|nr:hypothetical protein DQQ10_18830 [Pseudochryseolinea flava]
MLICELAEWIRKNKRGINYPGVHPSGDESVVVQYTRHEMCGNVHITDEHIFECCAKANSFEEHIELCRPIAKTDTEAWKREWNKPPPKARTRRVTKRIFMIDLKH